MEIIIWSWKTGVKIGRIEVDAFLGRPGRISFSPINWRVICVAYRTELDVWSLEICDTQRFKKTKQRVHLPPVSEVEEKNHFSEFKDEFACPVNAITNLEGEMAEAVNQMLDTRVRHEMRTLTWTNNPDELVIVAKDNFIFKVDLSECFFSVLVISRI